MPLWVSALVIVYLSLLVFAALWAAVERTRSARARTRAFRHAEPPGDQPEQTAAPLALEVPQP